MIVTIPNLGQFQLSDDATPEEKSQIVRGLYRVSGREVPSPDYGIMQLLGKGVSRATENLITQTRYDLPAFGLAMLAKAGFGGYEDKAKEFLEEGVRQYQQTAQQNAPVYPDVTELQGIGQYLGYGAEKMGEGLPTLLSMAIPGGIVAQGSRKAALGVADAARRQMLKRGLTPELANEAAAKAAARLVGTRVGATLGAVGAAQTVPESFREIYEQTGQIEPDVALIAGGINAMLEAYLPAKLLGDIGVLGRQMFVANAAKKAGYPQAAARIAGNTLATMTKEGITEAAQGGINNVAVKFIDSNSDVFSPENINGYINQFAAGFAGAAIPGTISAVGREARRESPQQPLSAAPQPPATPPPATPATTPPNPAPPSQGGLTVTGQSVPQAIPPEPQNVPALPAPSQTPLPLVPALNPQTTVPQLSLSGPESTQPQGSTPQLSGAPPQPQVVQTPIPPPAQLPYSIPKVENSQFKNQTPLSSTEPEDTKDFIKDKPVAKNRNNELTNAAQQLKEGEVSAETYNELANKLRPVKLYKKVPAPATENDLRRSLSADKASRIGIPSKTLKSGDPVGLRIDIPAFENHGTWAVSVHEQIASYAAGKTIGYESVAAVSNPTFGVVENAALNIAAGKPKSTIAVIKGNWKPITKIDAVKEATKALQSKDWAQVGMDPIRHSYFYDRATMRPVISADEVLQIGSLVLAKNVVYGEKTDFKYNKSSMNEKEAGERPAFLPEDQDMYDKFRAELDRLGLSNISLKMFEPDLQSGNTSLGMFYDTDPSAKDAMKIIYVAMLTEQAKKRFPSAFNEQRLNRTLHHEVIHALKALGLFTEKEWSILTKASEKEWINTPWDGDNGRTVKGIYAKESKETQIEEGIAKAFENYSQGRFKPVGVISKIFNKINSFFRKVVSFGKQQGISADEAEIFDAILSGKIGARQAKEINKTASNQQRENQQIILDAAISDIKPDALNNLVSTGPVFDNIKTKTKNIINDKAADHAGVLLAAFNLRQLGELAEKSLPQMSRYYDTVTEMIAFRDTQVTKASETIQKWITWAEKNSDTNRALADAMNEATLIGKDPEFQAAEITNDRLLENWFKVVADETALEIYREVRGYYAESFDNLHKALKQRIIRETEDNRFRSKLLSELEQEFSQATKPYFPLVRFGDYWVAVESTNKSTPNDYDYYMFESRAEQRSFEDALNKSNVNFTSGLKAREILNRGFPITGFVRNVMSIIDEMSEATPGAIQDSETLKDSLWQSYLTLQPDLSARKHFIKRKNIEGYSSDVIRGFAETAFHGAYHLARVKYGGELDSLLLQARNHLKTNPSIEGSRYLDELVKRHEWVNAPNDVNTFSSWATSTAFLWFLTSPASAIANMTQVPMVTLPVVGAKFGFTRTALELLTATKDYWASGLQNKEKPDKHGSFYSVLRTLEKRANNPQLSEEERKKALEEYAVMWQMYNDRVFERTQTLSLAGIAETPQELLMGGLRNTLKNKSVKTIHKVTYGLAYAFNQAEIFNREITALAVYRLAREKGYAPDLALKTAKDMVRETQFEYENATKPRFMQGPTARIIFQFKNYAQQMTMLYIRSLQQSFSDDKEVSAEARKRLGAMLFMAGVFAGYEGLPLYFVVEGVMNAMFDDEDEPYDFNNSAKNTLADLFGANVARALSTGVVSEITGADIASRVSQNGMWFRDSKYSTDEVEAFRQFITDIAGPFVGIGVNIADGLKKINDGNVQRGIEAMLPSVIKGPMKAVRMSVEGATTLRGDPIVEEVNTWGLFLQALGFTPTEVSRNYEVMAEIKGLDKDIDHRRKRLLQQITLAQINGDSSLYLETQEKISNFNLKNPNNPITPESIKRSLVQRVKSSERAVRGIIVSPKQEGLLEEARYAE